MPFLMQALMVSRSIIRKNNLACRRRLEAIAKDRQCMITGGSDFHGMRGRFPEKLGIWNTNILYADALQARLNEQYR